MRKCTHKVEVIVMEQIILTESRKSIISYDSKSSPTNACSVEYVRDSREVVVTRSQFSCYFFHTTLLISALVTNCVKYKHNLNSLYCQCDLNYWYKL